MILIYIMNGNKRLGGGSHMGLAVIVVMILSLWSITKTLEKLSNKILDKQDKQTELLEEIKIRLDKKST